MIFQVKYDRAMKRLKEQKSGAPGEDTELSQNMEKGDLAAMLISALIVILPVALAALGILAAVGYFFIVH